MHLGYKYFILVGGTDCLATNDDEGVGQIRAKFSNMNAVVKCGNGDPCGGPTSAALYSIDNSQSSVKDTSNNSHSLTGCFEDYQCSAVMSAVFAVVGLIAMCCTVGILVGAAEYYKSHFQLQRLADEDYHNLRPIEIHSQHELLDAETL